MLKSLPKTQCVPLTNHLIPLLIFPFCSNLNWLADIQLPLLFPIKKLKHGTGFRGESGRDSDSALAFQRFNWRWTLCSTLAPFPGVASTASNACWLKRRQLQDTDSCITSCVQQEIAEGQNFKAVRCNHPGCTGLLPLPAGSSELRRGDVASQATWHLPYLGGAVYPPQRGRKAAARRVLIASTFFSQLVRLLQELTAVTQCVGFSSSFKERATFKVRKNWDDFSFLPPAHQLQTLF